MVTVKREGEKPPYEKFYKRQPAYVNYLRRFGEVGVVTKFGSGDVKGKLADRGDIKVFVGYAENHAGDVYRMLNPSTGRISETRDIMWLNTYKWGGENDSDEPPDAWFDGVEPDIIENFEKNDTKNAKNEKNVTEKQGTDNGGNDGTEGDDGDAKLRVALQKLDTWYNPVLNEGGEYKSNGSPSLRSGKIIGNLALCSLSMASHVSEKQTETGKSEANFQDEEPDQGKMKKEGKSEANSQDEESDQGKLKKELSKAGGDNIEEQEKLDLPEEPNKFGEAWDHDDPKERMLWRAAIKKEFGDMESRQVWTKIKKSDMPADRRCVKNKWVFKLKRNGVHCARLVACGYSQIPGINYTDNCHQFGSSYWSS